MIALFHREQSVLYSPRHATDRAASNPIALVANHEDDGRRHRGLASMCYGPQAPLSSASKKSIRASANCAQ
jgi:hypothetical protein